MRPTFLAMLGLSLAGHAGLYLVSQSHAPPIVPPKAFAREEGVVSLEFAASTPSAESQPTELTPPVSSVVSPEPAESPIEEATPPELPISQDAPRPQGELPREVSKPVLPEPAQTKPTESQAVEKKPEEWPKVEQPIASQASDASAGSVSTTGAESIEPPTLQLNPSPVYPQASLTAKEEGRVVLAVRVNAIGTVDSVTVHRSSGHQRLDEAALMAVRRWKFKPGERNGQPAAMDVAVPVSFSLRNEKSPLQSQ